jgi:hypothetical protein
MSFRLTVFPFSDGLSARCPLLFAGSGQKKIKAETLLRIDGKEHLYCGDTAFFYSNHNQTDYLDSNYHKKLRKSPFYKSLTIRNGKIFQKIIELAKKA